MIGGNWELGVTLEERLKISNPWAGQSACAPWIGGQDDCTSFRRRAEELEKGESFVNVVDIVCFDS